MTDLSEVIGRLRSGKLTICEGSNGNDGCGGQGYTDGGRTVCADCFGAGVMTPELRSALDDAYISKLIATPDAEVLANSDPAEIAAIRAEIEVARAQIDRHEDWVFRQFVKTCSPSAQAAKDVLNERRRQVASEGWTPEHDDEHDDGELAAAAACYAAEFPVFREYEMAVGDGNVEEGFTNAWPWAENWFKRTDRRRDLVKAGALILAEIERLDRVASTSNDEARDEPHVSPSTRNDE